ncbi:MAG: hypothetical protein IJU23_06175 [Proteobacteria bacterium]|nr:hypothetical protein [Pseudomonadota bacterium]
MTVEDPKIIEAKIISLMLNAPEQIAFNEIAEHIEESIVNRAAEASRYLIICVRAFAKLMQDPRFQAKLPDFFECHYPNETVLHLTKHYFTDYDASRKGIPETEAQNAQTLISQPLGVQKAMARMHLRSHHEALLYSPWPQVIEILCSNPAVQERDIMFMASRRPTMNELLEPILVSQWTSRSEIRFALAANPALKVSHAYRCALTLPMTKLPVLNEMPELHPVLRSLALYIMNASKEALN